MTPAFIKDLQAIATPSKKDDVKRHQQQQQHRPRQPQHWLLARRWCSGGCDAETDSGAWDVGVSAKLGATNTTAIGQAPRNRSFYSDSARPSGTSVAPTGGKGTQQQRRVCMSTLAAGSDGTSVSQCSDVDVARQVAGRPDGGRDGGRDGRYDGTGGLTQAASAGSRAVRAAADRDSALWQHGRPSPIGRWEAPDGPSLLEQDAPARPSSSVERGVPDMAALQETGVLKAMADRPPLSRDATPQFLSEAVPAKLKPLQPPQRGTAVCQHSAPPLLLAFDVARRGTEQTQPQAQSQRSVARPALRDSALVQHGGPSSSQVQRSALDDAQERGARESVVGNRASDVSSPKPQCGVPVGARPSLHGDSTAPRPEPVDVPPLDDAKHDVMPAEDSALAPDQSIMGPLPPSPSQHQHHELPQQQQQQQPQQQRRHQQQQPQQQQTQQEQQLEQEDMAPAAAADAVALPSLLAGLLGPDDTQQQQQQRPQRDSAVSQEQQQQQRPHCNSAAWQRATVGAAAHHPGGSFIGREPHQPILCSTADRASALFQVGASRLLNDMDAPLALLQQSQQHHQQQQQLLLQQRQQLRERQHEAAGRDSALWQHGTPPLIAELVATRLSQTQLQLQQQHLPESRHEVAGRDSALWQHGTPPLIAELVATRVSQTQLQQQEASRREVAGRDSALWQNSTPPLIADLVVTQSQQQQEERGQDEVTGRNSALLQNITPPLIAELVAAQSEQQQQQQGSQREIAGRDSALWQHGTPPLLAELVSRRRPQQQQQEQAHRAVALAVDRDSALWRQDDAPPVLLVDLDHEPDGGRPSLHRRGLQHDLEQRPALDHDVLPARDLRPSPTLQAVTGFRRFLPSSSRSRADRGAAVVVETQQLDVAVDETRRASAAAAAAAMAARCSAHDMALARMQLRGFLGSCLLLSPTDQSAALFAGSIDPVQQFTSLCRRPAVLGGDQPPPMTPGHQARKPSSSIKTLPLFDK